MKALDSVLSDVMRLRTRVAQRQSNAVSERTRVALQAIIDEIDKLPSFATDVFMRGDTTNSVTDAVRFPFSGLLPGEHFDVAPERVASLRACASGWSARHGVRLTVRGKPNGGARCIRLDGYVGVPAGLVSLKDQEDLTVGSSGAESSIAKLDLVARGLAPSDDGGLTF
jgi:hypothetical protein